jgi:hypothetical protein
VRVLFFILTLVVGAALGHFGPQFVVAASDKPTELASPAPDPNSQYVKAPKPGESFGCAPLESANVFDDRLKHNATVWTNYKASNLAIQVSGDGKKLLLARATDVSNGAAQPEEFKITTNGAYYLMATEDLTLGTAHIIFDVRTMKMVWSFTGQGMLGMKGETVLLQCR